MSQTPAIFGIISTLLVLAITISVISLNYTGPPPSSISIHSYLIEWAQAGHNINLLAQRHGHIAALFSCALFILAATGFAPRFATFRFDQNTLRASAIAFSCFCLSGALWWCFQDVPKIAWFATSAIFMLAAFKGKSFFHQQLVVQLSFILLAIAGLAATVPGLLVPYDASWMAPTTLIEFQEGYSLVASQGDQIALGRHIFEDIRPYYGILLSVLCGLVERLQGIFTFGQSIQIIRFLQLSTVLITFAVYSWYARKQPLPMCIAFLMVLPWLHSNQISILFPNLSAWRNLGFFIAALGLMVSGRLNAKARTPAIGMLSGLCLSINQEIGLSIMVGLTAFLYFKNCRPGTPITKEFLISIARFISGLGLFLLLFYGFLTLSLGYFPNVSAYARHFQDLHKMAQSGYLGGFRIEYNPSTLLVFCHYCYILIRTGLSNRFLTERECFRAFAAVSGLVWLAYYFNRPHEWYFQPQFFTYGFLIIDSVRVAQSLSWKVQSFEGRLPSALAIAAIVIPQIVTSYSSSWWHFSNLINQVAQRKTVERDAELVSGVFVPKEIAEAIAEKVKFIVLESQKQQLLYVTGSTMFIPKLSRCFVVSEITEPFMELITKKQSDDLVAAIIRSQADEILFDDQNSLLVGDKYRAQCWKYLEEKISPAFAYDRTQSGWKIFKRVGKSPSQSDPTIFLKILKR